MRTYLAVAWAAAMLTAGCVSGTSGSPEGDAAIDAAETGSDLVDDTSPDAAPDTVADTGADTIAPDVGADTHSPDTATPDSAVDILEDSVAQPDVGSTPDADTTPDGGPVVVFEYPTPTYAACSTVLSQKCRNPGLGSTQDNEVFVIPALRWDLDEIHLLNRYASTQNIGTLVVCRGKGACWPLPPMMLAVDATVRIHLTATGDNTPTDVYLGDLPGDRDLANMGEVAIRRAGKLETYVRWGQAPLVWENAFIDDAIITLVGATAQTLWPGVDAFIEVCAEADGFIATANPFFASGYHAMPGTCATWPAQ